MSSAAPTEHSAHYEQQALALADPARQRAHHALLGHPRLQRLHHHPHGDRRRRGRVLPRLPARRGRRRVHGAVLRRDSPRRSRSREASTPSPAGCSGGPPASRCS
ncbi:hypothetical protein [Nocardioides convexus]|uniref:hypothetical protein n=1 Tax=Nocardioides convexus TaxID=2712224 RepID=UPI00241814CA|nr:hypothetical protein [Nocardioides convexus]